MTRSFKFGLLLGLLVCLSGCAPPVQKLDEHSFQDTLVPLWSMPHGCEGGPRFIDGKLIVTERDGLRGTRRTLDMSNGRVLDRSDEPVEPEGLPADTEAEISGQSLKPRRAALVKSITPAGFSPIVVTDRFIFAKRSWFTFALPKFAYHSRLVVIDRSSRNIVWHLDGEQIAIQASSAHIVVCNSKEIAAFLPLASRPQEITDFYAAIKRGDVTKVAGLFEAWKHTPLYDLEGRDPLTLAAQEGKIEVVKLLLARKVSPDSETADGYSPLLGALTQDRPEIVALLLDAGADPNNNARDWDFPLTAAAQSCSRPTIELLLKRGAALNASDRWMGETALDAAVMYRNYVAVEALLDAGADARIKDLNGETALEQGEEDECIRHLFSGGRISEKPVACAPQQTESGTVMFSPN